MRTLIFTLICVFSGYFSSACDLTITGPDGVCGSLPQTAVYEINFPNESFWCGTTLSFGISPGVGTFQSAVDGNGLPLFIPPGNTSFVGSGIESPVTVAITWNTVGCQTLSALFFNSGLFCSDCEVQVDYNVTVGYAASLSDITLEGGSPARACTEITLCAQGSDVSCGTEFQWLINGENITTESNCVTYDLESCPLTARVRMVTGCGTTNYITKTFDCLESPPPPLQYPSSLCIGNQFTLTVPGENVEFDIITDGGNQINTNVNVIYFYAGNPGWVIFTVSYTYCNIRYTRTIFVNVRKCNGFMTGKDQEEVDAPEERKQSTLLGTEIKLFPNPTSDRLTVQMNVAANKAMVFSMNGQMMKQFNALDKTSTLDISAIPVGTYILVLETDAGIITKEFVKI